MQIHSAEVSESEMDQIAIKLIKKLYKKVNKLIN